MTKTMQVKLGRIKPTVTCPKLRLGNYLLRSLPAPPASCDYSTASNKTLYKVYKNNELGCCVVSGAYHVKGLLSGNAGAEVAFTDEQVIHDYSAIGGYRPGQPSTDQGCNEQTALNYWLKHGFPDGSKLTAWLAVNPKDPAECRSACWLFEHLFFGAELARSWLNNVRPGFVWDAAPPDPSAGHCFMAYGYNSNSFLIDSWGLLGSITDAAVAHNVDELYVLLDPSMINKALNKAPNGFNWSQLVADFNALGGTVPVPIPPVPVPPGPPTPPVAPTVAQIMTVIDAEFVRLEQMNPYFARTFAQVKQDIDRVVQQNFPG